MEHVTSGWCLLQGPIQPPASLVASSELLVISHGHSVLKLACSPTKDAPPLKEAWLVMLAQDLVPDKIVHTRGGNCTHRWTATLTEKTPTFPFMWVNLA